MFTMVAPGEKRVDGVDLDVGALADRPAAGDLLEGKCLLGPPLASGRRWPDAFGLCETKRFMIFEAG
jgi:hypothetical protein